MKVNMQIVNKWLKKNKNTAIGVVVIVFLTWLMTHLFDWIASLVKINFGLFSKVLTYNIRLDIPIFAIILALVIFWVAIVVIKKYEVSKRRLQVIKALYGADGKYVDITAELNSKVNDDHLRVVLDNNIAGDPIISVKKHGIINYSKDGKKNEKRIAEGEVIDL